MEKETREGVAWIAAGLMMLFVAIVLACTMFTVEASSNPQWAMKDCFTLDDVTVFLNSLPPEKAVTAKVIAISSQRSFFGMASTPYYVWYQK